MFNNKELRTMFRLSKHLFRIISQQEQSCSVKRASNYNAQKPDSQSQPRPKYNHGLSGKGKSKRLNKIQDLPKIQGEIVFGLHPVYLAIRAERRNKFHTLYVGEKFMDTENRNSAVSELLELAQHRNIMICPLRKPILDQLAGNRPHQGVCLDADQLEVPEWTFETEVSSSSQGMPIWLLLQSIQDPMNLGAILRTAYYLGLDKVVIPAVESCRLSPTVSKASAGALEVIDLVRLPKGVSETALCEWWQARGWQVVGTALDKKESTSSDSSLPQSLYKFSTSRPTMVLLGNEGTGLSPDLIQACDTLVTIPNYEQSHKGLPRISSLNVSVAAGILLHWIKVSSSKSNR
ncbi:hypothetical protein EGW08_014455 [Elysia chlorotica]|uniref:rRNA methyltransferase 1, mitochondrial n=1 Tax=Elysia chlorotica TaxID=188477 RepID=A0A433T880_ELYCH|nr:hypothetical protein EGW08_014455 [Elysia chlorotica]